ncbi:hypothetical protein LIER_07616 [Lithospermum erythrorhizon]|uniref:Uncharacterized protein n=1 Tax=Lithospermum erythrorhizon TaxID=34254 RepID=A0AAV3PAU7_LITER
MSKPVLSNQLARWYLQLQQFEIIYVLQKAVKEQILADFLADHPLRAEWELCDDLPDEDVMSVEKTPVEDVLQRCSTPRGRRGKCCLHHSTTGYIAILIHTKPEVLKQYGSIPSTHPRVRGEYEVRKPKKMNKQADALAGLASSITYPGKEKVFWRNAITMLVKRQSSSSCCKSTCGKAYPSGAYLMISSEGKLVGPINGRNLKRYYP